MDLTAGTWGCLSAIYLSSLMGASWIARLLDQNGANSSMSRAQNAALLIGGGLLALVLALPAPEILRVIAGGFVALIALLGGVNDFRKKEPCHCLGGLIPDNLLVMNIIRLGAIVAAFELAATYAKYHTTSWSLAVPIVTIATWLASYLGLEYLRYSKRFYASRYARHDAPTKVETSWTVGLESDQPIDFGNLLAKENTLLIGISSTCNSCHQVADELGRLLAVISNALQVVVVSNSERMRDRLPERGFRYLVDSEIEIAKRLGVGGTPFRALIGAEGAIKFAPVDGKDSVLAKLKEVFNGFPSA